MNQAQRAFLERLAMHIPELFEAIRQGNVKSEYVLGDRRIDQRQVRLKLVVEVVDPGTNPAATHGTQSVDAPEELESATPQVHRRRRPVRKR